MTYAQLERHSAYMTQSRIVRHCSVTGRKYVESVLISPSFFLEDSFHLHVN